MSSGPSCNSTLHAFEFACTFLILDAAVTTETLETCRCFLWLIYQFECPTRLKKIVVVTICNDNLPGIVLKTRASTFKIFFFFLRVYHVTGGRTEYIYLSVSRIFANSNVSISGIEKLFSGSKLWLN